MTPPVAMTRAVAVTAGVVADRLFGEPPDRLHPVARFGTAMTRAETACWADRRRRGAVFALAGTAGAVAIGRALEGAASEGPAVAAGTYLTVAGRALEQAAIDVARALEDRDLPVARERVRSLVGRRTEDLGEVEIVRAVVESVAENTVDAVVAPIFWAIVGGAGAALGYRAVNTLDAMFGHRSPRYEQFGWASARSDDVANWVPARLTALLTATVRPHRARHVWAAVRHQAPAHPSPNAGVAEGAFAAALGIRLGGVNDYAGRVETRPPLGHGRRPALPDIAAACRLSRDVTLAMTATAVPLAAARGTGRSR